MCWVKLDLLLQREVQHSPQSVWSSGGHSLFFRGFLRSSCWSISSCWSTAAFGRDRGLLLGTGVQLVVSCTAIETQIVFKMLLTLVASQLEREVHLWSIGLLLGSGGWRWLRGKVLGRWGHQRCICLALGGYDRTRSRSFSLLPRVRLEGLFLCLPCIVVFVVLFLVAVINSHR